MEGASTKPHKGTSLVGTTLHCQNRSTGATCVRDEETRNEREAKKETAFAKSTNVVGSKSYLVLFGR